MNAPSQNFYLLSYLEPLNEWLNESNVTDIYVNRPGEIWVERLGEQPSRVEVPSLTSDILARLVRQIAAVTAQGINREYPLLAGTLPGGERIQAVVPPATRGEIAIAIRKHVSAGLSLEDYRQNGEITATKILDEKKLKRLPLQRKRDEDELDMLRNAVRERRNILVSGGTSSGKTTFVNALLKEIPRDDRLIVIEDTPELQIGHENSVGLVAARSALGEAEITMDDLLIASLRMRPDRIILGEIRGREATTFLRAINTGHPGSISTIHADSPSRAIDQLALLVLQTGSRMAWEDVVKYVKNSLDVIVQLSRKNGRREIESVLVLDECLKTGV